MSQLQQHLNQLLAAIGTGQTMEHIMRAAETAAGRRVVLPGDEAWLPASDWHHSNVVSIDGNTVRLIAIWALNPGHGAFRKLIAGIEAAGLQPCIVEPTSEMRATLTRWGWKGKRHGYGFNGEERWHPRKTLNANARTAA